MRRRVTVSMKGREFAGYDVFVMYKLNPRPHVHCVGAGLNISVPASHVGRFGSLADFCPILFGSGRVIFGMVCI